MSSDNSINKNLYVNSATSTPTQSLNNNYYAILDSGASHHFLLEDSPTQSRNSNHEPKDVRLPDGSTIRSSHKCKLDLQDIPNGANDGSFLT